MINEVSYCTGGIADVCFIKKYMYLPYPTCDTIPYLVYPTSDTIPYLVYPTSDTIPHLLYPTSDTIFTLSHL